ncbi:MAG: glycosyltransferase [Bacteroidales bacterium]|jgi:glycosyltransferase involved in cell wall biosynthesis
MKILFIINGLTCGGKERRLVQLIKGIKSASDIEIMLILMNNEIHYKEVFDLDIKIHYLIRRSKKDISVFYKFYQLIRNWKPDIVHCWDSLTAVYIVPACKYLKIKIINGMVVNTLVKQNIFNKDWFRARLTFPFSDVIVGNSVAGLNSYKAPENKSVCICNGIDLTRLFRIKEPSKMFEEIFGSLSVDLFIVGMVAAFETRKDYKTLIKAAIDLSELYEKICFILVGDGVNFIECKESIPDKFKDKIVFLGKKSDVESIVNIFDVGVLLINSKVQGEGISNSIIEYMALSKPVIATRGGGTNEIIIDNQNGFLIDPENADQLKEKICLLMGDRKLIERLGNKGEIMIKEKFDLKMMTRNYVELYKKLLNKAGKEQLIG